MQNPEDIQQIKAIEHQLLQLQSAFQLLNDKNHQLSSQLITLRQKKVKREPGDDLLLDIKNLFETKRIKSEFGRSDWKVKTEEVETIVLDDDDDSMDKNDSFMVAKQEVKNAIASFEPTSDSNLSLVTDEFKKLVNKLEEAQQKQNAGDQELSKQLQNERTQNKVLDQQVQDLTEENLRLMVEQTNVKMQMVETQKQIEHLQLQLEALQAEKNQQASSWQEEKSGLEAKNAEQLTQLQRNDEELQVERNRNQELDQQLQECKNQMTITENRMMEYEKQIVSLNEELTALRADKQQKTSLWEEEAAKLESAQQRLTEYESQIARLNEGIAELTANQNQQTSLWQEEKANLETRNVNLQYQLQKQAVDDEEMLNEKNHTVEALKQQLQHLTDENDRFRVEQENVKGELLSRENRIIECEKAIEKLKQELEEQLKEKNQQATSWQEEKSALECANRDLQLQLEVKDGDNGEMSNLLMEVREQKKTLEQQLHAGKTETEELKVQLATTTNSLAEHEKLIATLKQGLDELVSSKNQQMELWTEEMTKLEAKNGELQLQLQSTNEDNETIKKQLQELSVENTRFKEEQESVKSQLVSTEERVLEHDQHVKRLEQELEEVLAENNHQISLWEQMKTCLEDKIDDLRASVKRKDEEAVDLVELLEEEQKQRNSLQEQLEGMEKEKEELRIQLATTENHLAEHGEQIKKLELELEELNVDKDKTLTMWEEEKSFMETNGQELNEKLQAKESEIGDLNESLSIERKQSKDLEYQMLAMSEDNLAMEKRLTEREAQIKMLEEQLEESLVDKTQTLKLWEEDKTGLEDRISDVLAQMEQKDETNRQLGELLHAEKERSNGLDEQLVGAKEQLDQLKTQLDITEKNLQEHGEQIKMLEQQLAELSAVKEQEMNAWIVEKSKLEGENAALEQQLKHRDTDNGELNELLLVERNRIKAQEQQLIVTAEEKDELKALLVTMEKSMTQYENQIKELTQSMADMVAEKNEQTSLWEETKTSLEASNKEIEQQLQKKDADNRELSKLFLEEQNNSKDLSQQLLVMSEEKSELNSKVVSTGNRLLEHEDHIKQLEQQLSKLQAEKDRQMNEWAVEKGNLEDTAKELSEQLQKKDEEWKDLGELLMEERNHSIDLEQQLEAMGKESEDLKAQLKSAEKSLAKQEKKVKQLQQELVDLNVDKNEQIEVSRAEKTELETKNAELNGMINRLKDLVRNVDL